VCLTAYYSHSTKTAFFPQAYHPRGADEHMNDTPNPQPPLDVGSADSLKPFIVLVADNFHYQDSSETYQQGSYPTLAAAIAISIDIVEQDLKSSYEPGMTAADLYSMYTSFGNDPFIVGPGISGVSFSAWTYAKQRCDEICASPEPRHPAGLS
jgi:hypothetical protein